MPRLNHSHVALLNRAFSTYLSYKPHRRTLHEKRQPGTEKTRTFQRHFYRPETDRTISRNILVEGGWGNWQAFLYRSDWRGVLNTTIIERRQFDQFSRQTLARLIGALEKHLPDAD